MHHKILREQTGTVSELQDTSVSVFVFAGQRRQQVTASGHTKKRDINQAQSPTTTWTKPHRHYLGSPAGKPSIHTNALLSASVSEPAETERPKPKSNTRILHKESWSYKCTSVWLHSCAPHTQPQVGKENERERESLTECVWERGVWGVWIKRWEYWRPERETVDVWVQRFSVQPC